MADRKTAAPNTKKAGGAAKPGAKPGARPGGSAAARPAARPPAKKPGKSIVNQKQTPWGLIVTAVLIVVFAVAVVGYAVTRGGSKSSASNGNCTQMVGNNKTTYLNELQCAKDISGVTFTPEANRNHVDGTVKYDTTPPVGGQHSPYWADCTGTVYAKPIASENAVHSLEHGAVWITYRPDLAADQIAQLSQLVNGNDRLLMSPYPDLKSPITVQSWGYQLSVNSATDPRIQQFITDLRYNPKTTPEYGATCSQPSFKKSPSTFGKPLSAPADGSSGGTMGN